MSLQTNLTEKVSYVGTDSAGQTMAITMNFYDSSEIFVVEETTATGVETATAPVITTDYTITGGAGTTGTLTTVAAVATTKTWHIYRRVPLKQTHDYTENDSAPADATEDALGKLALMLQDQQEQLDRCLKFPVSEDTANSPELSIEETRASGYQGYDSDGLPVTLSAPTDTSITTAFAKTLLDDDNAPAARTTLDAEQKLSSLLTLVRGDLIYVDSSPAIANLAVGASGQYLRSDGTDASWATPSATDGDFSLPQGYGSGCGLTRTDANTITIATGEWRNADDDGDTRLTSSLAKDIDTTWAVGAGGGLNATDFASGSSDAEASTWYHVFLIKSSSGTVDAGFDKSVVAANLLTDSGYTEYRRIGSVLTDSSRDILTFFQDGDVFMWELPVQDSTESTPGLSARTITLGNVPTGVRTEALVSVVIDETAVSYHIMAHGDMSAPAAPTSTLKDMSTGATGTAIIAAWHGALLTNTSAQIKLRAGTSDPNTVTILTKGWIDRRGK